MVGKAGNIGVVVRGCWPKAEMYRLQVSYAVGAAVRSQSDFGCQRD